MKKQFENIKDKNKLIKILMNRCQELWDENESLKFHIFNIENNNAIVKDILDKK